MNHARELARAVNDYVVAFRRDLHQHPEPSLKEFRTTDRICEELDKLGVSYRRCEPTGVIAEVKGTKGESDKIVMLRGDIDALSIQEKTGLPFASVNDGFMHACGHDTHGAMLLGAVKVLSENTDEFAGTVRFVFQPAEEVGEGAALMVKQGAMENVQRAYGIHIGSLRPVGQIAACAGASHAACDSFKITVKGVTCHGAAPHTGVDALVCASAIVMNLQTLVSRETDPSQQLVVTVGSFHAGSRFNIVTGEAVLEGTCRSFSREIHDKLPEMLNRVVQSTAAAYRCTAELQYDCLTDVLVCDEETTTFGLECAKKVADSADMVVRSHAQAGGEDFAEYTKCDAKCTFFSLGAGGDAPQHSEKCVFDESAFEIGVALYVQLACDTLDQLNA